MLDFVLPLAASDEARLLPFLASLKANGPYQNKILIIPTAEMAARQDIRQFMGEVGSLFGHCDIEPLTNTPESGWPHACNIHFKWANIYRERLGYTNSWMWLEADCSFLARGWPDLLETEYRLGGFPYMGHIGKSHQGVKYPDGTIEQLLLDPHMEGVAIYPPNHGQVPMVKQPSSTEPFDIYCRYYTTERGGQRLCTDSKQQIHRWRTGNYRMEGDKMVCSDFKKPLSSELSSAGEVDLTGKVLLHGIKDDSLERLLLGDKYESLTKVGNLVRPAPTPTLAPIRQPILHKGPALTGEAPPERGKFLDSSPRYPATPQLTENFTLEPEPFIIPSVNPVAILDGKVLDELIPGVWATQEVEREQLLNDLRTHLGVDAQFPTAGGDKAAEPSDTGTVPPALSEAKESQGTSSIDPAVEVQTGDFSNIPLEELREISTATSKSRLGQVMEKYQIPKEQREDFRAYLNSQGFNIQKPAFWFVMA